MKTSRRDFYNLYRNMHTTCYNPDYHSYHRYGGRGIKVCDRWHNFDNFIEDAGEAYQKGFSLDRIDVDKDYAPENCRWIPKEENTKTGIVNPLAALLAYENGLNQKQLAKLLKTDQPHISRILSRGRKLRGSFLL